MRAILTFLLLFAPLVAQTPPPQSQVAPTATGFLGNKESKVFHKPECKLVLKTKPENKVSFAAREDAVAAGYTPCKICLK